MNEQIKRRNKVRNKVVNGISIACKASGIELDGESVKEIINITDELIIKPNEEIENKWLLKKDK